MRPCFNSVSEGYDIEVNGELKIAASIHYHRLLARGPVGPSPEHLAKLATDLHAVGPDLHERRAAAFAGMLLLGRVNDIVPLIEYGDKLLNIRSGRGYGNESDSLMALMSERWEDLSNALVAILPPVLEISGPTTVTYGTVSHALKRVVRRTARFSEFL